MAVSSPAWFLSCSSDLTDTEEVDLQATYGFPSYIVRPAPHEGPHLPPLDCISIFRDQVLQGFRFPLHSFFCEVSRYFAIPLNQFVPQSFSILVGFIGVSKLLDFSLSPRLFHHFFIPRRVDVGIFKFQSRPKAILFNRIPPQGEWYKKIFYMRLPSPPPFPIQWIHDLPSLPDTQGLLNDPSVASALPKLRGAKFSLPHLIEEGLMFPFGIGNINTPLDSSFGEYNYFTSPLLIGISL
mgnify:CR=1 FL=1